MAGISGTDSHSGRGQYGAAQNGGVPKYGEIVIDANHISMLANAFDAALSMQTPEQQAWSKTLLSMLHDIHQESAIYLMVRRLRD